MPTRSLSKFMRAAVVLLLAGSTVSSVLAQDDAAKADLKKERAKQVEMLTDWIHYSRINRLDLAKDYAQALLDSGLSDTDFVALIDDWAKKEVDFNAVIISSQKNPELEVLAGKLNLKYQAGKKATARNATDISRNIGLLTKSMREREFGRRNLITAGEYATPQLLQALLDKGDAIRQAEVRQVLVDMGKQAIIPLCTALGGLDPANQQVIVTLLGDAPTPYGTALPFLYELRESTKVAEVKKATERAIVRIAGGVNDSMSVSQRFVGLANDYYTESRSLTSFPDEDVQLLWTFDTGIGLLPTAIATPVFHEAMSMRLSERALGHDKTNAEALALWLASNFSREIDSPAGYENPVYPKDRRDAMYYAVAAGATASDRVLIRALDDKDTPLARKALAAIEKTAGASGLWASDSARKPLLEAIGYPNRRVQYEAALALGGAQPRTAFAGSDRVVPLLASAIRTASARYALIIADRPEDQPPMKKALEAKGFTVLPPATKIADIEQEIANSPGIDLVITVLTGPLTESAIRDAHSRPSLAATPVLSLVNPPGFFDLEKKFAGDRGVKIARGGITPDEAGTAAEQLLQSAVGDAVSENEAKEYKAKALAVLRDLAVSGNTVLNVTDAAGPLTNALSDSTGPTKLAVAEVLSYVPTKSVQVALMDAAATATGEEQVSLLNRVADSAKRFGNQLDARHVATVVKLAMGSGSNEQATAAAALMGALKLPNSDLIPLILGGGK